MGKENEKKEYLVLVLMSVYNGEKYLKEQLDSILGQKGCDVMLLIRDDGSVDEVLSCYWREKYRGGTEFF